MRLGFLFGSTIRNHLMLGLLALGCHFSNSTSTSSFSTPICSGVVSPLETRACGPFSSLSYRQRHSITLPSSNSMARCMILALVLTIRKSYTPPSTPYTLIPNLRPE